MRTLSKFASTAALALAATLVLSCSSGSGGGNSSGDDPSGGDGSNYYDKSSNSSGGGTGGGSSSSVGGSGSVVYGDPVEYQGETYQTVVIGTQTWFARNLNYNATGSKCYENNTANCTTYGGLYDWETAKTICPSGWHLPTQEEWETLSNYVDSAQSCSDYDKKCSGKHLKAKSGWNDDGNGQDTYGFAALPGGNGNSNGIFRNVGNYGYWWSASENNAYAYGWYMSYNIGYADLYNNNKTTLLSVRCVKD